VSHAKLEKFARMANQIGDFHAALPPEPGAEGVATHIRKFWTPKMIAETLAALDQHKVTINETASRGFAILRRELADPTAARDGNP
jgi:formate dehydrogenase subunit delta